MESPQITTPVSAEFIHAILPIYTKPPISLSTKIFSPPEKNSESAFQAQKAGLVHEKNKTQAYQECYRRQILGSQVDVGRLSGLGQQNALIRDRPNKEMQNRPENHLGFALRVGIIIGDLAVFSTVLCRRCFIDAIVVEGVCCRGASVGGLAR